MLIPRIYDNLGQNIRPGKALLIYGPRQVGKTTLLKHFLAQTSFVARFDTGEDIRIREVFESSNFSQILELVEGYDLLVIDEAQKIPRIGEGLKIIVDHVPNARVIATGSSSFDLAGKVGHQITCRKTPLTL